METDAALCGLSVAFALVAAGFLSSAAWVEIDAGRKRAAAAVEGLPVVGESRLSRRVRNGYPFCMPLANRLMRNARVRGLAEEATWLLVERGRLTTPEALLSVGMVGVTVVAVAVGIVAVSPVAAVAVAGCATMLLAMAVKAAQERRRMALREAVPDALRAMGVCFQAGLSLLQTFQQVARETQGPLGALFSRGAHLLETGSTASEALRVFRVGDAVPELAFAAVALDVQHQTGGSMAQVLDAVRDAVEGELELERSLRVQTAQAKLSARIVSIMPFVLIALFSLVSEDFLAPFFSSVTGMVLLVVALGMQATGVLVVRRMLRVEVE